MVPLLDSNSEHEGEQVFSDVKNPICECSPSNNDLILCKNIKFNLFLTDSRQTMAEDGETKVVKRGRGRPPKVSVHSVYNPSI